MKAAHAPDLDSIPLEATMAQVRAYKDRITADSIIEASLIVAANNDQPAIRDAFDHLLFLLAVCDQEAVQREEDIVNSVFASIYTNRSGVLNRRFFVETAIIERVRTILFNGSPDEIERLKIFMAETRRE